MADNMDKRELNEDDLEQVAGGRKGSVDQDAVNDRKKKIKELAEKKKKQHK